jgi:hypothetical protein
MNTDNFKTTTGSNSLIETQGFCYSDSSRCFLLLSCIGVYLRLSAAKLVF